MYRPILPAKGLAAFYQEGLNAGEIRLQHCDRCSDIWHYPRPVCPKCGSRDYTWITASGKGVINSFTIVHHAPTADLKGDIPYVIGMIDLEEGARMTGAVIGQQALLCQIGDPVTITIPVSAEGEPGMPQFQAHSKM